MRGFALYAQRGNPVVYYRNLQRSGELVHSRRFVSESERRAAVEGEVEASAGKRVMVRHRPY